jgi:hypothetical protein
MEEGTLAAWALETCVRFGEKLVITDSKEKKRLTNRARPSTVLRSMNWNSDGD